MNSKILAELLLVSIVILIAAPTTFARPEYLTNLTDVYGTGSCNTCHINGASGGPRTDYGTSFENQPNYATDPSSAIAAVGSPPSATGTSIVTATTTATPTSGFGTGTPTETATETATVGTTTGITTETATVGTTTGITTETATVGTTTGTARSPGFGIVVSIVGLFAWAILGRRKK